jgi:hypothetical protein
MSIYVSNDSKQGHDGPGYDLGFLRPLEISDFVLGCSLYDDAGFVSCRMIPKHQPITRSDEPSGRVRPFRAVALVLNTSETRRYISEASAGFRMSSLIAPTTIAARWRTSQVRRYTAIRTSSCR